jgi:hypothetical protein
MESTVHQASYTEQPQQKPQDDDIYKIYQNNQDQFQTQPRPVEQRPVERPVDQGYAMPHESFNGVQNDPNNGRIHSDSGPIGQLQNPVSSPEEESFTFFRRFKKVYPVKIDVSFDEMIAEPNYVRQTALNFEGDIIKFYTKELMKKIWSDPSILENQIYKNLELLIMGKPNVPDDDFHKFVSEETFSTKEEPLTAKIVVPTKVVKKSTKKNTPKDEA